MFNPDEFFARQLADWRLCAGRYEELRHAKRREITLHGRSYILIHNPLRAVSATAKVENGNVAPRPCFLCRAARPGEQRDFVLTPPDSGNRYRVAVNPFPILSHHFTIISERHCRQTITPERLRDMQYIARQMAGYLVFFNGAAAGASAPDHLHFQAVRQTDVPLTASANPFAERLFIQNCDAERVKIDCAESDDVNVLCWFSGGETHWTVARRRCHRPRRYFAEGAEHILISPAALEYAGVVPLAREEDYAKMTAEILDEVLRECFNSEPIVDVGLSNEQVRTVSNAGGTTTIQGIRIGTSFHWEEQKALTYEGRMLLREDAGGGAAWLVNRIEAEKYLRSVIASEMAATSNLSLLKAHAVISRSWLVRRLNRIHNARLSPAPPADGEIVRWYDASAHDLFDVCADDHCQRYQGLPEKPLETVDRAIAETRGEVLIYAGRVIDARFSKCCGGRTEEYSYCWENIHPPYLVSVPDTRADGSAFCNTRDRDVLSLVLNDYDLRTSDFFDWVAEYTQADLSDIVETKQRLGLGLILSLEPLERGRSGRISRLKITGERGSIVVGKELEIRRTLSRTHLYSSCFDVETSRDPAGGLVFTLRGRGWGHGVGLCQIGAAVMGAEGYDYREILSHYYKGALVERIW